MNLDLHESGHPAAAKQHTHTIAPVCEQDGPLKHGEGEVEHVVTLIRRFLCHPAVNVFNILEHLLHQHVQLVCQALTR